MKKKKKIPVIRLLRLLLVAVAVAAIIFTIKGKRVNTDFYQIGSDKVPAIEYILGKAGDRTGESSYEAFGGVIKQHYEYQTESNQNREMAIYSRALRDEYGFISINEYDFSGAAGKNFQFAAESAEKDMVIIAQLDYNRKGYSLSLTREQGSLKQYLKEAKEPVNGGAEPQAAAKEAADNAIVLPAGYFQELSPEDIMAMTRDYEGLEIICNEDGSYTYKADDKLRQQLLEGQKQQLEETISYMLGADYPFIADVKHNEDYSEFQVVTTENLFERNDGEAYVDIMGIVILGYSAPIYQYYQGKGLEAKTVVMLVDARNGEVYRSYIGPDDFFDWAIE